MSVLAFQAIQGHVAAAAKVHETLCNTTRAEVQPQVIAWALALRHAFDRGCVPWISSLKFLADVRAKKLGHHSPC